MEAETENRPDLRSILNRAGEAKDYAPPHLRGTSTDNVKRIAEFVTKLTWREITTISDAVQQEYRRDGQDIPDLAEALVVWAEKLLGEHSPTV